MSEPHSIPDPEAPPEVGGVHWHNNERHIIVSVDRIWTPYTKKDQTTKVVGYSLGLKRIGS